MAIATAALGGTGNNQPKEAAEETMAAARVTAAKTTMATVTATIMMLSPTLMTVHRRQRQGHHSWDVPCG
jgi:hypothetical protein